MRVAIVTTYAHKVFKARKELISEIINNGYELVVMGPEEEYLCSDSAEKIGAEYIQLNILRHNVNPIKETIALVNTVKQLKNAKIDIVIVYGTRMIPNVITAAKIAGIQSTIGIINGAGNLLMLEGIKGAMIRMVSFPMLKFALKSSNKVIFQNKDDFKDFKANKLVTSKNVIITNGSGVNTHEYKMLPLSDRPDFLLVSRITGSKGIDEFLEAAKIVKQRYPESTFSLVGPKDDNDGSIDWDKLFNYEQQDIIKYYGESNDIIEHLRKCRVYVFPSYYREGVPRSTLEAMSTGRPIITTDSPGCRETVEDTINGFLINPKDVNGLVEKMIWMIENPKIVEQMSDESRRIAVDKFDVHKVNEDILASIDWNKI